MRKGSEKTVSEYITECPKEIQDKLRDMRFLIKKVAPTAVERMDYFGIPGYSYEGYDYDGMFVWFSYKKPYIRLHVRPPVLQEHIKEVSEYSVTKSIISFPENKKVPVGLAGKLIKASINVMKKRKINKK